VLRRWLTVDGAWLWFGDHPTGACEIRARSRPGSSKSNERAPALSALAAPSRIFPAAVRSRARCQLPIATTFDFSTMPIGDKAARIVSATELGARCA
jgi:hypothetical protein